MKITYESIKSHLSLMTAIMDLIIEDTNEVTSSSEMKRRYTFFRGKEINESLLLKELEEAKLRAEEMRNAFISGSNYIDTMMAHDPDLLPRILGTVNGDRDKMEVIH